MSLNTSHQYEQVHIFFKTKFMLFICRGLPLYRNHDRNRKWRRMDEEGGNFVYREGTLDQTTLSLYNFHKVNNQNNKRYKKYDSITNDEENNDRSRMTEDSTEEDSICIVSLKDVIT